MLFLLLENSALNQFEINYINVSFFEYENALFSFLKEKDTNFLSFVLKYCNYNKIFILFFFPSFFSFIQKFNNIFIFNNFFIYSLISLIFFYFFFFLGSFKKQILPKNYYHIFFEKFLLILQGIVKQNFPNTFFWSQSFFPLVLTLFFFIFSLNLVGLYPYSFTTTSFIFQTFILSCTILIGVTLLNIFIQGIDAFLQSFVPKDIPQILVPLLIIIEVISYVSRAFSLAIRLFANMMSGHTLLHILSDFSFILGKKKYLFGIFPFLIVFIIFFLEIGVAILQAYVFTILFIIYLNDACQYNYNTLDKDFLSLNKKEDLKF